MSQPKAHKWLWAVMSELGPPSHITKLVLCAVHQRVDWDTGREFFEGSRSLGERLGLNKDTVNKHLRLGTDDGWLSRRKRAITDRDGNERSGYVYSLNFEKLSEIAGQAKANRCPNGQALLSEPTNAAVRTAQTYSPLNPPESKKTYETAKHPNLRSRLKRAAKYSHERPQFEKDFPDVMPHIREIGGWMRLGQSNEEKELPGLLARIIDAYRDAR